MPINLTPIKVTLRRDNADGSPRVDQNGKPTVYPSFRVLPKSILKGQIPSDIIDAGVGWKHNKVTNLGHGDPFGEAVAFVPPDFAGAAIGVVDSCEGLNEGQARLFLDDKHFSQIFEKRDAGVLESLKAERDLRVDLGQSTTEIDAKILRSLDPDDREPGVRRLEGPKDFAEVKSKRDMRIVPPT